MTPEEAERNRLALEWTTAHWSEIEDASLEEFEAMQASKKAWIDAEMAKLAKARRKEACSMTVLQQTIEAAMRDQAPKLHAELKAAGRLSATVRDLESQISEQVTTVVMEQRLREGWDRLPPQENAARMKTAASLARETALAEVLQFPPDGTSSPSPAATTD